MDLDGLMRAYLEKKADIIKRLEELRKEKTDEELFAELAFCLLTPQSKAKSCWLSIERLRKKDLLFSDSASIRPWLNCRFGNNKAGYIESAKNQLEELKQLLKRTKETELREWLVKNIKGYGYKEASHFLRNIGFEELAILDRHVLKNLKNYGVIEEVPKSLTPKKYKEIEEKMRRFSKSVDIPISHLDLLFWSNETGEIFK